MIRSKQVDVGQSVVRLSGEDDYIGGMDILVRPDAEIEVGGEDLVLGSGFPVTSGSHLSLSLREREALYAVASVDSVRVVVLESGI